MSSAVVTTSAALGRPFVFDEEASPEVHSGIAKKPAGSQDSSQESPIARVLKNQKSAMPLVTPASQLEICPAPEMVSSGIPAIDALTGGLPRGCLTEICGPASSGRTTLLLAALAAATRRGEFCVVVDASDALDPQSAAAAGVDLERLLWVRCSEDSEFSPRRRPSTALRAGFDTEKKAHQDRNRSQNINQTEHCLEQVLRATDLLLESGGFGLIVLDLGDLPQQSARRIPLTTWFRFRRAVEHKPTVLLAIEQRPIAGSCSSLLLQLGPPENELETLTTEDNRLLDGESAAKRQKNAAHGASRGLDEGDNKAPEERKKIRMPEPHTSEFPCLSHTQLLAGLQIHAELIRSRIERKPARSVMFATKTAWAG